MAKSKLPKSLITVTPLSKTLALILFIALPFLGFYFGFNYQSNSKLVNHNQQSSPLPTPDETVDWKTYTGTSFGYSFKYPADYKPYFKDGNAFYSSDAEFDKITTAKTKGAEIGSTVFGPGEDIPKYDGPNSKIDPSIISKLILPVGVSAKAYVNTEDVGVIIDYVKENKNMKLLIWCGGENGNEDRCKSVLIPLLSTMKIFN